MGGILVASFIAVGTPFPPAERAARPAGPFVFGITWTLGGARTAPADRPAVAAVRVGMRRGEVERKLGEDARFETYYGREDRLRVTAHYPSLVVTYGPDGTVREFRAPKRKAAAVRTAGPAP